MCCKRWIKTSSTTGVFFLNVSCLLVWTKFDRCVERKNGDETNSRRLDVLEWWVFSWSALQNPTGGVTQGITLWRWVIVCRGLSVGTWVFWLQQTLLGCWPRHWTMEVWFLFSGEIVSQEWKTFKKWVAAKMIKTLTEWLYIHFTLMCILHSGILPYEIDLFL